jgi:hypothetical protein
MVMQHHFYPQSSLQNTEIKLLTQLGGIDEAAMNVESYLKVDNGLLYRTVSL